MTIKSKVFTVLSRFVYERKIILIISLKPTVLLKDVIIQISSGI